VKEISILGCGWLGKPLGASLVEAGYQVSGSTTHTEKTDSLKALGICPFLIDIQTDRIIENSGIGFFDCEILVISIPPRRKTGNESAFLAQMETLRKRLKQSAVKKVLFISSTSVYKNEGKMVLEEDTDASAALAKAEQVFIDEPHFQTTVIRFGGLVGPGRHPGKFLAGKRIGGANHPVNMIHLKDCIGVIQAVFVTDTWGEIFNACADLHPRKEDFYKRAAALAGLPSPQFENGDEHQYKIVSNDKIKRILNYTFIYPDPMTMDF
jgi:nucleoside-diphosphate-sugar epimerase